MFLTLIIGYLCGSIPFGLVLTKIAGKGDVRTTGSGNIGSTNVLRHAGRTIAALTLLCDVLKGTVGVLLGIWAGVALTGNPQGAVLGGILGGLGAFLGHLYPIWLGFKGGKGVATLIGVLIAYDWRLAIGFCVCWLVVAGLGRISSLSALVSTTLICILGWVFTPPPMALAISVMSLLVAWRHRENITRILAGEEPRIGAEKTNTSAGG